MDAHRTLTAFIGDLLLMRGDPLEVARAARSAADTHADGPLVLIFDDASGRQVDLDVGAAAADGGASHARPRSSGRPGRPKLGVVSREVTLLPRHWSWLGAQPGGASVTLRRLVDAARSSSAGIEAARQAREAADRFMLAMLGNQPGYEEAARALYRGEGGRFAALTDGWPADLRDHARRLAAPSFSTDPNEDERP